MPGARGFYTYVRIGDRRVRAYVSDRGARAIYCDKHQQWYACVCDKCVADTGKRQR